MTRHDLPRWLGLAEVASTARVLQEAYGGPRRRHLIKTLVTPHLIVPGRGLVLGVTPDYDRAGLRRRVQDAGIHVAWLVHGCWRSSNAQRELPWVLHPGHAPRWRAMNLARSAGDGTAASLTMSLGLHVLRLADAHGVEVRARVDRDKPRLLRVYCRRGFEVVGADERQVYVRRQAAAPPVQDRRPRPSWRNVLRTGRTTHQRWHQRFGRPGDPMLDIGAGDSPFAAQLQAIGISSVMLDPQYALRPPARPGTSAVAGTAEALPFRSRTFGTVNASHVLQHSGQARLALLECLRVARADGVVVVHPVWRGARRQQELASVRGVRLVAGRAMPPRRQRPSLVISVGDFNPASAAAVATVLQPGAPARIAGGLAMRLVIALRRTTAVGPGALR
jgi:SAM-dependent methyltransferase